jgi:hypothetical protein
LLHVLHYVRDHFSPCRHDEHAKKHPLLGPLPVTVHRSLLPSYRETREQFVAAGVKSCVLTVGGRARERGIVEPGEGVHTMARLTLTLLGGFRARLDLGTLLALPTRKNRGF